MMNVRLRPLGFIRPVSATLPVAPPETLAPRADTRTSTTSSEVRFFLKASRPGFWLTSIWFYLLPLAPQLPFRAFEFWLGLFYVGFPLGMLIYACAAAGRRTTATVIGPLFAKLLIALLLGLEALIATHIEAKPWLAPFVALAALWFLLDALVLWRARPYAAWQMTGFFLGWNALLMAEILLSAWKF